MKVHLLCVGKVGGPLASAVSEYEARARRYWRFEAGEVEAGAPGGGKAGPDRVREAEGRRLLARIPDRAFAVALTREGRGIDSQGLARLLEGKALDSTHSVAFVVGGAYGLHELVLERCDQRLSLSEMTLPHEMARLVLVEQLYRAGTILRNEPYHKGS